MERIETRAMIDSLTQLEGYYQSKYEYYLAMATEAKENKERVGLLLLDLDRDVPSYEDSSIRSSLSDGRATQALEPSSRDAPSRSHNGSAPHRSLDPERAIQELPQAKPSEPASSVPYGHQTIDEEGETPSSVEQMKRWTLDLFKAMSVIESVSNSDSGKALHQNYLHHLINRELDIELSEELVELYLEEAIRRGYLEPDEFNNDCYIAKSNNDLSSEALLEQNGQLTGRPPATTPCPHEEEDLAIDSVTTNRLSGKKSNKPYELPPSDKLKPTLLSTVEGYIEENRPKRFSIDDVVNYLYPQSVQSDWNKVQRNKVRTSISNVLSRKGYLGKYWSRIKPGVYRPRG